MNITNITTQLKRAGRYSLFVDEQYAFSLSEAALLDSGLHVGVKLTEEDLEQWKQTSSDDKLYGNLLRYVAMRMRSRWELEEYLRRKDVDEELAKKYIAKLKSLGLVDDLAFAHAWIETRRQLKPSSRIKLTAELRAKHVKGSVITEALGEEANDNDALIALVTKCRKQVKYQDDLKLMQYLARQGFHYDDIKSALATSD